MPIAVVCPNAGCGRKYSVPDNAAGRSATCANCGTKIAIPQTAAAGPGPGGAFSFEEDAPAAKLTASNRISHLHDDEDEGRPRKRTRGGNAFVDFLLFRAMITPWLLIIGFWIAAVGSVVWCVVSAAFILIQAASEPGFLLPGLAILSGALWMPLALRVGVEILISIFRIRQELVDIRQELAVKK